MNLRGLAFLAIRLLAIYVFIMGIRQAVNLVNLALPMSMYRLELNLAQTLYIGAVPSLLLWIVGILLWRMADRWSTRFVPTEESESETAIRNADFEGFVLSVAGLVIAILAVTSLIQGLLGFAWLAYKDVRFDRPIYYYQFAGKAAEIAIGIVLVLKSNGIAALLRKIRQA